MQTQQVNVRLDQALLDAIDARCAENGVTRTQWLSTAARWVLAQKGVVVPVPGADL